MKTHVCGNGLQEAETRRDIFWLSVEMEEDLEVFSSLGCSYGLWTRYYRSGPTFSVQGDHCSVPLAHILGHAHLHSARWVGVLLCAACLLVSVYRINHIRLQVRHCFSSTPFLAYFYLCLFNCTLMLALSDPESAQLLYPPVIRFIYAWIVCFCLFSMLVIVVYKMLFSVFLDFNPDMDDSWFKPFYGKLMFAHLCVVSFFVEFPTTNQFVKAFQFVVLSLEALVLGIIGLWFGVKLHRNLKSHQTSGKSDYKKALFKIKILLIAMVLAVCVSIVFNMSMAQRNFKSWDTDLENITRPRKEVIAAFWSTTGFLFFVCALSNILGLLVFGKNAARHNKGNQGLSFKRKTGEQSAPSVPSALEIESKEASPRSDKSMFASAPTSVTTYADDGRVVIG